MIASETESKNVTKTKLEENYTLIEEPGSEYLWHLSPKSSSALNISESILEFLSSRETNLLALGCDGTATNTGE